MPIHFHTHTTIRILNWPNPRVIVVSWRGQGRGCYNEQEWVRTKERAAGICAYSGQPYASGELIFKPTGNPINADERIALRSLEGMPCGKEV